MGLSLCCFDVSITLKLVMLTLLFQLMVANSLQQHLRQPSCHDDDISALLQFKQSFSIDASASDFDGNYPKTSSWKLPIEGKNNNTCCSWDGVKCDETSGHVIGLNLSSSQLYGSINSNSSLFRLVHLQSLDLSDNNFNYSQIPSAFSNFPRLSYLNLAASFFFGQIPSQVAHLSKLSFLDLSRNTETTSASDGLLKLDASIMKSLVQNLTRLEILNLGFVDISSTVPDTMANLSLLTSLVLRNCKLFGKFPERIFHFQNLEVLSVRFNNDLTGYLPEFNQSTPLTVLKLAETSFSGDLPYSLGNLHSLKELDIGVCNFSQGPVPSFLGNLRQLAYLDISKNKFHGPIPDSYANLTQLVNLQMSENGLVGPIPSWIGNLTRLEYLDLGFVDISSTVPDTMANLSLLKSLFLKNCKLHGEFPARIFHLQSLEFLNVRGNPDLIVHLPEFNQSTPLTVLDIANTRVFGELPNSFGNLLSLEQLDIGVCNLSGPIPALLGNLRQLTYLDISDNPFHGPIPDSYANLTQLVTLRMLGSGLVGPIPSWIGTLTTLVYLDLAFNALNGSIPTSVSSLTNLQILYLHNNNLSGRVNFNIFQNLQFLYDLQLNVQNSKNHLELLIEPQKTTGTSNATYRQQFESLLLNGCSLKEFPYFLRYQERLKNLDLSFNNIHGRIPKWMWNISTQTMVYMDLSNNFLSGFDQLPIVLPWVNLNHFIVNSNKLHGSLPIPPPSIIAYETQNNALTGEILPMFCNCTSLEILDVSNNSLSGMLPQCLGNFSDYLGLLLLGSNSFHGLIPQTYTNKSSLRVIDVSHNKMQGKIPRSLENCFMLELLHLSNNTCSDVFPFWLGNLPHLKILSMRYNDFYGVIGKPEPGNHRFPDLRILDLSYNKFTGEILIYHVFSETAMIMRPNITVNQTTYMNNRLQNHGIAAIFSAYFTKDYSLTIANKGVEIFFPKIQEAFASIDLSSNKFEGRIDPLVGKLKGLHSLNISHNLIYGSIPSSLGSLPLLESLDLSDNKLSGYIPLQLAQLTFLSQLNVSHNNLTGSIPQGSQLSSFNSASYEGNPGLCGAPLPIKCGNPKVPLPPASNGEEDDDDTGLVSGLDWIFVVSGFVGGSVVGVVLSNIFVTRRRVWLIKIVVKMGVMKQKRETGRRRNRV